jgi:hypothetical protein
MTGLCEIAHAHDFERGVRGYLLHPRFFLLDPHVGGDGLVMVIRHRDPDKTWTIWHPSSWRPNRRRR